MKLSVQENVLGAVAVKRKFKNLLGMRRVKKNIKITPVGHVDEVLKLSLTKEFKRVEWVEVDKLSKTSDNTEKVLTN